MKPIQPVFIVGNVHSGTTLVQKVLGRNAAVFVGSGETQFFFHLPAIRSRFALKSEAENSRQFALYLCNLIFQGYQRTERQPLSEADLLSGPYDLTVSELNHLTGIVGSASTHEDAFFNVFYSLSRQRDKALWVEKTPAHIFSVDKILKQDPTVKFVEVVRDPRAILASKQRRASADHIASSKNPSSVHQAGGFDPLLHSFGWKSSVKAGSEAQARHPAAVLRVKYEDFTQYPEQEIRKLCEFLGVTYAESMQDVGWTNTTTPGTGDSHKVSSAANEAWRTALSPDVIGICQWVAHNEMNEMGYPFDRLSISDRASALTRMGYSTGIALPRMIYSRWQLGGTKYLQAQAENYLKRIKGVTGNSTTSAS